LPTIVYPSRTAKPTPALAPPAVPPAPACVTDDTNCQPQYVLVGGIWGYWDRYRHFHRVSATTAHALRPGVVASHPVIVARTSSIGHERVHR
jgi:hypothetical protein